MNVHPNLGQNPDDLADLFSLSHDQINLLETYRHFRHFDCEAYLALKSKAINAYYSKYGLKGAVIGVSGGIDSALALALMVHASKQKNSCIEQICPVFLPVHNDSATNQNTAFLKAKSLCDDLGLKLNVLDLTQTHENLSSLVQSNMGLNPTKWSLGQFVAHCRTPSLYYCATLLSANNYPSIVIGTTNKDEGMYLGYVGKASDGLVDLQVISDLHKSEVNQLARYLNVNDNILKAVPHGDLYDGRSDVELFGASYDFVELYHFLKQVPSLSTNLENDEKYQLFSHNLENLHAYNRHKYFSCSPAVHLDIIADLVVYPQSLRSNLSFSSDYRGLAAPDEAQLIDFIYKFSRKKIPYLGLKVVASEGKIDSVEFNFDFGLYEKLL